MVFNLVIKIPAIAANICLAYLVADILKNLGTATTVIRRAWIFMLLCPTVLYFGSAQFVILFFIPLSAALSQAV